MNGISLGFVSVTVVTTAAGFVAVGATAVTVVVGRGCLSAGLASCCCCSVGWPDDGIAVVFAAVSLLLALASLLEFVAG
jgi:hypothetical protein